MFKGTFMTIMQVGLLAVLPYAFVVGNVWWWSLALAMYIVCGFIGTVVTMHRLLAHKTFKTSKVYRYVSTFFGSMGSLLSPLEWVAQHVAHHRFSDTEKDPHSPVVLGWKAMFFMFHSKTQSGVSVMRLAKEPFMKNLHTHFYAILLTYITALFLIGGFKLVVFAWAIPCLATLWGQVLLVMVHDENGAYNGNWFTRIITFNETKHKYHHENPGDISQDGIIYWFINLVRTDKRARV